GGLGSPIPARGRRPRPEPTRAVMALVLIVWVPPLRARLHAAVDKSFAGPLRDVDPRIALTVTLRGSRARGVGCLTVVLPGFGDAVALLGLELRRGRRLGSGDGGHRDRRGDGRGEEQACVHRVTLLRAGERSVGPV